MRFCVNTKIAGHKNTGHIKKRSISRKGNNVSESIEHHDYNLYFTVAMQNTVKWQECMSPKEHCESGNSRSWKLPILYENCCLYIFKDKMECQSHASLKLMSQLFLVCTWCRGTGFLYGKGLHFARSCYHTLMHSW
jgi:hypothetical protein